MTHSAHKPRPTSRGFEERVSGTVSAWTQDRRWDTDLLAALRIADPCPTSFGTWSVPTLALAWTRRPGVAGGVAQWVFSRLVVWQVNVRGLGPDDAGECKGMP